MSNPVTEHLIAYHAYDEDGEMYGVIDVELPTITSMKKTIKGAGISGEVEVPLFGHTESLKVKINWRSLTPHAVKLSRPGSHLIEVRGALQEQNASTGEYRTIPHKVVMRTMAHNIALGKLAVGEDSDTNNELEVSYLKVSQDGVETLEIDKFNYIYKVSGTDYLKDVRVALGRE